MHREDRPTESRQRGRPRGESTVSLPGTLLALLLAQGPQHKLLSDRQMGRPVARDASTARSSAERTGARIAEAFDLEILLGTR